MSQGNEELDRDGGGSGVQVWISALTGLVDFGKITALL